MSILTADDITEEAILAVKKQLLAQDEKVEQLRHQLSQVQLELANAESERSRIANMLQWRSLMAEVERDDDVAGVTAAIEAAVAEFHTSLQPPEDYDEKLEGIPFSDTDDYADFSLIETIIDDRLEAIRRLVADNAAPPEGGSAEAGEKDEVEARRQRRRALLMLVVLSVNVSNITNLPTADIVTQAEEMREGVASQWDSFLFGNSGLLEDEKEEWRKVVRTFLGPPYDTTA
ncbi:hypothetical protein TRVL_08033 [Trypanosoma vivax]|nr:hypothetical protein TRVL_08033 [Trypanosoma vivax]